MIAKDTIPTYAQYNEDVTLAALLQNTKKGFYVDVGANQEEYHSVTKYFYSKGWRGINIEPIPRLIKEFLEKRKDDLNLGYAVSQKEGRMLFREYPKHDGFSTFSEVSKKENAKRNLPFIDYKVKVDSLENIFNTHKVTTIDFMKVDVEGFEEEVLKSNDWKKFRPRVICIEANHRSKDWSDYLINQDYKCVIFDGLNEYYLAKESLKIFDGFAERAAILAHNALRKHHYDLWENDLKHMDELRDLNRRQDELIKTAYHSQRVLEEKMHSIKFLLKQIARQILRKLGIK